MVILNGGSSAGKSSLIERFITIRAASGDCWVAVGVDDFIAKLPWQWMDLPSMNGPCGRDGLRFDPHPEGIVPTVGPVGRRMMSVYRRSVATWAESGFNVLADEVAFDDEAANGWKEALGPLAATWVGVHCDPDVAAARERARGDRIIGLARGSAATVHRGVTYDFELDTTRAAPDELAAELSDRLLRTSAG